MNSLDIIWKVIPVKSTLIFKGVVIQVSSWSLWVKVAAAPGGAEAKALIGNKFGTYITLVMQWMSVRPALCCMNRRWGFDQKRLPLH